MRIALVGTRGVPARYGGFDNPAGFHLFGMPIATAVWLLAGVLAVVVGLLGASRSARANAGAPGRLVTAGVDNTAFGADALATKGDVGSDRS
jgi:hypothetical protein